MSNKDTEFHKRQERLTEQIYQTKGMLPSRYVFILTNLCNLRCDFCFQEKKPRADAMTTEDWINLSKQLPDYARITLTGGEPLMFKGFEEVFREVADKFDCNIITNGLLLTEKEIDFLLSFPKFKVLSISIDNIGNTIRGVGPQQWEYLIKILNYFVRRKRELNHECVLDIKTMVLDENADELFNIYKTLQEKLQPDTFSFQLLKGSPIQHADYMFTFENILEKSHAFVYNKWEMIKKQLEKIKRYNTENDKIAFLHPKLCSLTSEEPLSNIDLLNEEEYKNENFQSCKFPWSSVHINVDGHLFPCLAVSVGNVKEKPLKEIIEDKNMQKFRNLIKECGTVEACNRCGWLRVKER